MIPADLLDQLPAGSDAAAALDQGGLLDSLKKALAERALNAEMDRHLGDDEQAGNSRNGYGRKTVMTDTGKIEIDVPRDRQGNFDPHLIAKDQRRFPGFYDKIISMYARGMSTREITGHLRELYGIEGFPDAITAVFPQAVVQTCIVHLLRNSMDFVSWKDHKPLVTALKGIYRAIDAQAAEEALAAFEASEWGKRYPAIGQSWRRVWSEVVPSFAFPDAVRRIIYTTNAIEALNSKLRRAVRAKGHFPSDEAATKLL